MRNHDWERIIAVAGVLSAAVVLIHWGFGQLTNRRLDPLAGTGVDVFDTRDHETCESEEGCDLVLCYCPDGPCPDAEEPGCPHPAGILCDLHRLEDPSCLEDYRADSLSLWRWSK